MVPAKHVFLIRDSLKKRARGTPVSYWITLWRRYGIKKMVIFSLLLYFCSTERQGRLISFLWCKAVQILYLRELRGSLQTCRTRMRRTFSYFVHQKKWSWFCVMQANALPNNGADPLLEQNWFKLTKFHLFVTDRVCHEEAQFVEFESSLLLKKMFQTGEWV